MLALFGYKLWREEIKNASMKVKVAQSCLSLCESIVYTVHGILQARILVWQSHSSILAWRIPWTEKPGGRCRRVRHDGVTNTHTLLHCRRILYQLSYHESPMLVKCKYTFYQ